MNLIVFALVILAAHLCLTPFVPATSRKAWVLWPFDTNSKPVLSGIGGLPQSNGIVTLVLAGIGGLALLGAAGTLLGIVIPADGWLPLITIGAVCSITLHLLYFRPNLSLLPLALDVFLLIAVFVLQWTPATLQG